MAELIAAMEADPRAAARWLGELYGRKRATKAQVGAWLAALKDPPQLPRWDKVPRAPRPAGDRAFRRDLQRTARLDVRCVAVGTDVDGDAILVPASAADWAKQMLRDAETEAAYLRLRARETQAKKNRQTEKGLKTRADTQRDKDRPYRRGVLKRHADGMSDRRIAIDLGLDRKAVARIIAAAQAK